MIGVAWVLSLNSGKGQSVSACESSWALALVAHTCFPVAVNALVAKPGERTWTLLPHQLAFSGYLSCGPVGALLTCRLSAHSGYVQHLSGVPDPLC